MSALRRLPHYLAQTLSLHSHSGPLALGKSWRLPAPSGALRAFHGRGYPLEFLWPRQCELLAWVWRGRTAVFRATQRNREAGKWVNHTWVPLALPIRRNMELGRTESRYGGARHCIPATWNPQHDGLFPPGALCSCPSTLLDLLKHHFFFCLLLSPRLQRAQRASPTLC